MSNVIDALYNSKTSQNKTLDLKLEEKKTSILNILNSIESTQREFLESKSEEERKQLGQFFTGAVVANYMASMIHAFNGIEELRILDAGAGAGILAAAAALRCLELGHNNVHAVLYEVDNTLRDLLKVNMEIISDFFKQSEAKFTFEIHIEDFVLCRPDKIHAYFHISLINPPYFKYNTKISPYSKATADLFEGNPNIYASFIAVVSASLYPQGQVIVIVPRSFTNGRYFKGFRHYINKIVSIEKIHIFNSRNRIFKEQKVLQENIICKLLKKEQASQIEVLSSNCYSDLTESNINIYSASLIIDSGNEHLIIRIPETSENSFILKTVEGWPTSFEELGYYISTGPVVKHRTKDFITTCFEGSVPLLQMHNVKAFNVEWTGQHNKDLRFLLLEGHERHTVINSIYVILKRFTSKDEERRLVAGVHDPKKISGELIGLENHLNYIGTKGKEMCLVDAYGLAALFNSSLMDQYFRCISGNTQVNATEINLMKLPLREKIIEIGHTILNSKETSQVTIDDIVNSILFT